MAKALGPNVRLYPSFRRDVIDVYSANPPHCLLAFPFHTKGKRKDDLILLSFGQNNIPSNIVYYEHPVNRDTDDGIEEIDSEKWRTLVLHALKSPTSCSLADVSGNGFHDLIVTFEYGNSLTSPNVFGGRVCWLENYGTDEDDWAFHNIGRFPGVNMIKVGHYTTTYSLQILAVVRSSNADIHAPLIIFTKPDDVYKPQQWHVNIVLEPEFSAIQDVLVVKNPTTNLDYVLVSCEEGLIVTWYAGRSWHSRPLHCLPSTETLYPGRVRALRDKQDPVAYIVTTEVDKGVLSLYTKAEKAAAAFPDIVWSRSVLMDFQDEGMNAEVVDLACVDIDGDGTDEILVSVNSQGSKHGIYYFDKEDGQFVRYKIAPQPALQFASGRFDKRSRLDLATLSLSIPREIAVHYNHFTPSQIRPFVEDSDLVFSVPRVSSFVCEADIIDVTGYVLSLVLLPPDATYHVSSDGTDAVKVLHGSVGWIDGHDRLVERTRASGRPSCTTSMLVECHEGIVRSGNDGAVFVRLRPSRATDNSTLQGRNILPSYFPCSVCEFDFLWESVHEKPWASRLARAGGEGNSIYHLEGFRLQFEGGSTDFAYVHFWASEGGVSTGFTNQVYTPWKGSGSIDGVISSIRACLANPGGSGGLEYCDDLLDWGATPPTKYQLSRAKKTILPMLHEEGPLWRNRLDESDEEVSVEYPWHTWVGDSGKQRGLWHVWASFDFPPFTAPHTRHSNMQNCVIS